MVKKSTRVSRSRKPVSRSSKRVSRSRKSSSRSRKPVSRSSKRVSRSRKSSSRSRKPVSGSSKRVSRSRKSSSRSSKRVSRSSKSSSRSHKRVSAKQSSRVSSKSRKNIKEIVQSPPRLINVFVKGLVGDLIQIEISNDASVLDLKRVVSDSNGMNVKNMVIVSSNTEQPLDNTHTLRQCGVNNDDMLFLVNTNEEDEPPFKGQNWIKVTGKKLKGVDEKFYTKFQNTANIQKDVFPDVLIGFEGSVNNPEFISLISRRTKAKEKLENFMRELEEAGGKPLRFVYHKDLRGPYTNFTFIATNEDSSLIYDYTIEQLLYDNEATDRVKYYIRGYFIQYSLWKKLTVEERRSILESDDALKDVLQNGWRRVSEREQVKQEEKRQKENERKAKKERERLNAKEEKKAKKSVRKSKK